MTLDPIVEGFKQELEQDDLLKYVARLYSAGFFSNIVDIAENSDMEIQEVIDQLVRKSSRSKKL